MLASCRNWLVGHWAMQIVIIDKYLVSEFRKFYWTLVWQALILQFAQAFLDCQFQLENSFQQITWQRLVQSLGNFCIKGIAHFGHFWPILAKMCFTVLRENFFVWPCIGLEQAPGKKAASWRLFSPWRLKVSTALDWSAHLIQKLTLAQTYNLKFIKPDEKDLSGNPAKNLLSVF